MKISRMGRRALALAVLGGGIHAQSWALSASDYKVIYSGADAPASFSDPINNGAYALVPGGAWSQSDGFVSTDTLLSKSNLPKDGATGGLSLQAIDNSGRIAFIGPYVPGCSSCIQQVIDKTYYGVMSFSGEVLLSEWWTSGPSGNKFRDDYMPDSMAFYSSGSFVVSWNGSQYFQGRSVIYDPSLKSAVSVEGGVFSLNNTGQALTRLSGHYVDAAPLRYLDVLRDLNSGDSISGGQFDPSLGLMSKINDLGQVLFYNDASHVYTVLQGPSAAVPEISALSMWGMAGLLAAFRLRTRRKSALRVVRCQPRVNEGQGL